MESLQQTFRAPFIITKNKYQVMKNNINIILWISFLLISTGINAQNTQATINSTLNGTVIDQVTNQPIPGVNIQIKGTTHTAVTDLDGKFYFQTGQKFPYILVVSYIGYVTVEHTATSDFVQI